MARFGKSVVQALTQPAFTQGLFTTAQQVGAAPRLRQQREMLSKINTGTPEGLGQLAKFYQGQGDMENAVKYATASRDLSMQLAEQQALEQRRKNLTSKAKKLGLNDLANRIPSISDPDELKSVSEEIYKRELDNLPTQSVIVRKQRAADAGISPENFDKLGLAKSTDQEFNEYITGQKGNQEAFLTTANKVEYLRVNEFGRVWDNNNKKWVEAQDLGLERAPELVQRVEQVASTMGTELAKLGAERFAEAAENAQKSSESIRSIDQSYPNIDNMFTGYGAEFRKDISRFANVFGIQLADPEAITDTETYIARSATRVAEYITNLGAGTGLSDADREFAKAVVGGSTDLDAKTLKKLLGMLREDAVLRIEGYNSLRDDVSRQLGPASKGAMAFYPPVAIPVNKQRSEEANTYLSSTNPPQ